MRAFPVLPFAFLPICAAAAPAAQPEVFAVLADTSPRIRTVYSPWSGNPFPNRAPSAAETERGFMLATVDCEADVRRDTTFPDPSGAMALRVFSAPGQTVSRAFVLRTLRGLPSLTFSFSRFASASGGAPFPAGHLDLRLAVFKELHANKNLAGHYLIQPPPGPVPRNCTLWFWLSVHIPKSVDADETFAGTVEVASLSTATARIPLTIRAIPVGLDRPRDPAGLFLPGHFHYTGVHAKRCYAWPDWRSDTVGTYLRFWKSRHLNSPSVFHVYPQLRVEDGQVKARFPFLARVAEAMRNNGLGDATLCVDLRFVGWWANVAGNARAKAPDARFSFSAWVSAWAPVKEPNSHARAFFREAVRQLLATAREQDWPRLKLLPEEEMGNAGPKLDTYRAYMPLVREMAPERFLVLDNDIGYGRPQAVDRGHRDHAPVRQYNSWTQPALRDARRDGADVWTYNYGGFHRANFGFLQLRLGSVGNHQWADHWTMPDNRPAWVFSLIEGERAVTSVEYERIRNGLEDLAVIRTLENGIRDLRRRGHTTEAKRAKTDLHAVVKDLPVAGPAFRTWLAREPDLRLGAKRWKLLGRLQAVQALLAGRPAPRPTAPSGEPGWALAPEHHVQQTGAAQSLRLEAPVIISTPPKLDGRFTDHAWRVAKDNWTSPLQRLVGQETGLRARAGSIEEYERIPAPSFSQAGVAYSSQGLYLAARCNHVTLERARAQHGDNDGEIWRDDCMEFFLRPAGRGQAKYQLVVNAKGAKTLFVNGTVQPADRIRVATTSPINDSGGLSQEILIPWSVFGLDAMPAPGTVWSMNVAREFHSFGQLTSWGRVWSSFHQEDQWGVLVFSGRTTAGVFERIDAGSCRPGPQVLRGAVRADALAGSRAVRLVRPDGSVAAAQTIKASSANGNAFSLPFRVPRLRDAENWQVQLVDAGGKELGRSAIRIPAAPQSAVISESPSLVVGGLRVRLRMRLVASDAGARESRLVGCLIHTETKQRLNLSPLTPTQGGEHLLWLRTRGLVPGQWTLSCALEEQGTGGIPSATVFEVLPCP